MAWTKQRWVVGGALAAVGVVLLFSEHSRQGATSLDTGTSVTSTTIAARPCTVTVTADVLIARSRPDSNARIVDTYTKGETVSANRTISNGFRELAPGRWGAADFLQPTPGSDCG